MKPTRLLIILVIASFVFLMLGGFGSLASNGSKMQGRTAQSGLQSPSEQGESDAAPQGEMDEQDDPDLPSKFHGKIDKETYLRMRDEYIGLKRGFEAGRPFDPMARGRAIEKMEEQQNQLESGSKSSVFDRLAAFLGFDPTAGPAWTALGPAPLSIGSSNFSGRVTAVVVDPTNPNVVYLGAAQGGVWRSLDGGATWVSIFDNAQSLAIGALAIAPSDHTILC